jgi:hypothetical protein
MNQKKPDPTNKTSPEALFYFIKNAGKIVINFIQDMMPKIKKLDEDMTKIGIEAEKINKETSNQPKEPKLKILS